jgi:putative Mg2+ transporter-C (MgtC) family protein
LTTDDFLTEFTAGLPDEAQISRVLIRLVIAALLGGIIGIQREYSGKPAGLRTHMLVALGSSLFMIIAIEFGMSSSDLSHIIQGLTAGIGFIGGGAILKSKTAQEVTGLTTAASIWLTAGIGLAVGLGRWGSAVLSVILTWIILTAVYHIEISINRKKKHKRLSDLSIGSSANSTPHAKSVKENSAP